MNKKIFVNNFRFNLEKCYSFILTSDKIRKRGLERNLGESDGIQIVL